MRALVCACVCIMFSLVQDGTLTSQRLIHHLAAEWQSDIYGCLMQACMCVCVSERKSEDECKKR